MNRRPFIENFGKRLDWNLEFLILAHDKCCIAVV